MAIHSLLKLCVRVCSSIALTTLLCACCRLSLSPARKFANFSVCLSSFSQKLQNPFLLQRSEVKHDHYHSRGAYFLIERSPHRRRMESHAYARTSPSLCRYKSSPRPLRLHPAWQVHRPDFREALAPHACHL